MRPTRGLSTWIALGMLVAFVAWASWSFATGGTVRLLMAAASDADRALVLLRAWVERAGIFGPAVYVAAVMLEVVIAPLPGTLLYAPGGAIFGGGLGGTLSLVGNVGGAVLAATIARLLGHRVAERLDRSAVDQLAGRIRRRGLLIIVMLRVNPLTSSDIVSYAAGLVGVPVWRVGIGTLIGMAPLCYAQAYAAETIFGWVPGGGLLVLVLGLAYATVVVWLLVRPIERGPDRRTARGLREM